MRVSVAYSPRAGEVDEVTVELPPGATLADAIRASGMAARHPGLDLAGAKLGVWGRVQPATHPLRERDRVEIYRALQVDPKEARRQRYRGTAASRRR
ncbi:RnfH family protein [Piscinibacter sp.]|uniref:RnfH family protein n=1 Tax=Piscinibacter sp. TaxID=1903157 RepID=UPI0039E58A6B